MSEGRNVGFIGLGDMGRPMVDQLLKNNVPVRAYDAAPEACRMFAQRGVGIALSPADLASGSDFIVCMLPHPDILRAVLLGSKGVIEGAKPGTIVIDMSTDGPAVVKECADQLRSRGVEMMDAPVGKGPWAAEKGDLMILMGGERETCTKAEWLLAFLGSELLYCGPLGSGQVIKVANNIVSASNVATIVEAYNVAKKMGANLEILTKVMGSTAADSFQLKFSFQNALDGKFEPGFKTKLALKDLLIAQSLAHELSATASVTAGAIEWYQKAVDEGHGELDQGALLLTVTKPARGS